MGRRPTTLKTPKRRFLLDVEALELRLTPTTAATLTIPLDPTGDRYGDQIVTVQAYQDTNRAAFGIFDTGASALTFSAKDQESFTAKGYPIPIKVPGGAHGDGLTGVITGDVSEPGTILAAGLHAATISFNPSGSSSYSVQFGPGSAATANIQAFIGTEEGSPNLPTVTGNPIMRGGTSAHPGPYAALVNMQGANLDFSSTVPGLSLSLPDLTFVNPGYRLTPQAGSIGPVTIPLVMTGTDNHGQPGNSITESQSPLQNNVTVGLSSTLVTHQTFLFDTGAQVTVISTALARALGLNLSAPTVITSVSGANGTTDAQGFVLDELDLPLQGGGTLRFTHVPVAVLDVAPGLDGILGMNLWDSATQMLYDPFGGPTLSVAFRSQPLVNSGDTGSINTILAGQGLGSIGGADHGNNLPGVVLHNGQITGEIYRDYNANGVINPGEHGIPNQIVYLDLNHTGNFGLGDPSAVTDQNGVYHFSLLTPGSYTVRQYPGPGLAVVTPASGSITVQVQDNTTVGGVNFGDVATQGTVTAGFVGDLYGQIFDRPPDASGLSFWTQILDQGGAPQSAAQGIWQSTEHFGLEVAGLYQRLLHRQADANGVAGWVSAMQNGLGIAGVEAAFLASPEYQAAHSDNASFVLGLYSDVLARNEDGAGAAGWIQALGKGMSRAQVARAFLGSDELYLRQIDSLYVQLLHRPADQGGEQTWLYQLKNGLATVESVAEALLSSSEFRGWSSQHS